MQTTTFSDASSVTTGVYRDYITYDSAQNPQYDMASTSKNAFFWQTMSAFVMNKKTRTLGPLSTTLSTLKNNWIVLF